MWCFLLRAYCQKSIPCRNGFWGYPWRWFPGHQSLPIGCVVHKQDVYLKKPTTSGKKCPIPPFWPKLPIGTSKEGSISTIVASYNFYSYTEQKHEQLQICKPFSKSSKGIHLENGMKQVKKFYGLRNDSVSFINNSRKNDLVPVGQRGGKNPFPPNYQPIYFQWRSIERFRHRYCFWKPNLRFPSAKNDFDVLAINSWNYVWGKVPGKKGGQVKGTPKILGEKRGFFFTSDDFVFHPGFYRWHWTNTWTKNHYRQSDYLSGW